MNHSLRAMILIFLMLMLVYSPAFSEEIPQGHQQRWFHGMRVGVLAHDVPIWSLTRKEEGVDINSEFIFLWPDNSLAGGRVHSNIGASLNTQGDTSKIYAGGLWEYTWKNGLFFSFGLGLSVHDGALETDDADQKELGARVLFRIPFEMGMLIYGNHGLTIMFDHVSNAYLAEPNEGLDTLGIRYAYQF